MGKVQLFVAIVQYSTEYAKEATVGTQKLLPV